ncbi:MULTISPECIES: RNA methyltransferase [unclassified Caulobacter]|uniref:TrmH family RNA methyltransferase n=1 Tax=unclassified Caulobacter TaxID=2648921 RepID=UPI0006F3AED4|nr:MULTISPECIES: RNA methyltransferase [unclassified Caulobacter]KQV58499.1 RNA methyltransferase [Caulobacter sp. Root342]KQV68992.1 RNA methyltransferase [Caulobacter sp. Root343]
MPQFRVVTDPDDPAVAPFRAIKERDLVGREGLFIAEGETVLRAFVRDAPERVVSLLIDPKRKDKLAEVFAGLPDETPVHLADQAVVDAIAGFHLHRGVLAVGRKPEPVAAGALLARLPGRAVVLVLCGIANHDNIGGIYRNAAAFGADAVILDADCCDPLYRKAIRVSVGAALSVPTARLERGEDIAELLAAMGFESLALSPSATETLARLTPAPRTAVLLGAEGPGLSPEVMAGARTVGIPMAGGFDSLNVATTSGIVLHHLRFARG